MIANDPTLETIATVVKMFTPDAVDAVIDKAVRAVSVIETVFINDPVRREAEIGALGLEIRAGQEPSILKAILEKGAP